MSPAEQLVVNMAIMKINAELMRQRYAGPEPFQLFIAEHLTPGSRKAICKPFEPHWNNAHMVEVQQEFTMQQGWWFMLDAIHRPEGD
jgi:hypothetical protein